MKIEHNISISAGEKSRCMRCDKPWGEVEPHYINYSDDSGMFPLCQGCWPASTKEEKRYYVNLLLRQWEMIYRTIELPDAKSWTEMHSIEDKIDEHEVIRQKVFAMIEAE